MPLLNPQYFFGIIIIVGRGIILLLRLSQGIASGCHNANSTTIFFGIVIIVGTANLLLLRLGHGISSGCHLATPTRKTFSDFSLLWEGDIMLLLRLSQGIYSGFNHATPTIFFRNCHDCGNGHYASAST